MAQADLPTIAAHYTEVKKRGAEYIARCCFHSPDANPSLSLYHKNGKWNFKCFSCGESGDAADWIAKIDGVDTTEALKRLNDGADWKPKKPIVQEGKKLERITSRPPPNAGEPKMHIRSLGEPSAKWAYRDTDGAILGWVARYDTPEGKEIRCWTWGAKGESAPSWGCGHWTKPRPLFGLDGLARQPETPVMLVEGEKAAVAAQGLLGQYVVCTWSGGAQAWKHANLEPLRGRRVDLWPDNDQPGKEAMQALALLLKDPRGLGCYGKMIDPRDMPEGGDAADWTGSSTELLVWLKARATWYAEQGKPVEPPPEPDPAPAAEPSSEQPQSEEPPLEVYESERGRPSPSEVVPSRLKNPRKPRLAAVDGNTALAPEADAEPLPEKMSEDALADHFADQHGQDWRYVKEWGRWFEWAGDRWQEEKTSKAERLAVEITRQSLYWNEAVNLTPRERRSINRKNTAWNVRDLAATDRRIAASVDQWDRDPLLLGVPGGVIDLRDGSMRPASRESYISKNASVAPGNGSPRLWLEYLNRVQDGQTDIISYLQRYVGYCATGEIKEHALAFLYGTGRNGKGVFLETIGGILGDYTRTASMDTFMEKKHESHSTELARLHGARLVITEEAASGGRWNEARIKHITGGGKITAHYMRCDDFEFTPTFKLLIAANHKPMLRSVDEAIKARIHLVPFGVTIPAAERDQNLVSKLREEWPQILGWILDGCSQWQNGGLKVPQAVLDATQQYVDQEDVLGQWIDECCVREDWVEGAAAYRSFSEWSDKSGERPMSRRSWSNAMIERGFTPAKNGSGARMFDGISLKMKIPPEERPY